MSPQTTNSHPSPITALLHENPDALRMTSRRLLPPPRGFWPLLLGAVALNVVIVALGVYLFAFSGKSVAPPAGRKIVVPFADKVELWDGLRGWVVQEDGRNKPFETFCREAVRTVTGQERFEGNDPIAVVVSWLMLYEADVNKSLKVGRNAGCDWENYPFLLCNHHELRELLYREHRGENVDLSEEDLHGKYVEPWVVRHSSKFKEVLREAAARTEEDAKAPLTPLETKARELKKRLALYDQVRAGGQEGLERVRAPGELGLVALDRHGKTWFSLRAVREYAEDSSVWAEMMRARHIENPQSYERQPEQSMPATAVQQVAAAADALQKAYRSGDADQFKESSTTFLATVERVSSEFGDYPGTDPGLELWYNRNNPFRKAWVVSLLASLLLLSSLALGGRSQRLGRPVYIAGLLAYGGSLLWSIAGFYCRVKISGRPPVSNMYESVIWVGFMTAVFGLVLELVYRRGVIALAATLVSTFGLVLADQLPLTLAPNIQPLQAVLRSNYWLVIHVLTIVSSYAAFALAWGLGNINLGLMVFAPGRGDLVKTLSQFCYRAIQIGVVLIAAGTLLGGFWAAESWGRFWGWDPKEVWALIALLCYVIPLHARYVGWVKDFGLAACSVVCFASVVMAWYGVNFVLGAGLHSYGFGGGNDIWVYWGALINISLVLHAALRYRYSQPALVER
ncbi:MAG: cytochrome c biogenesis protein CcsA [Planctomycetes bacterium]|nr:cytochrome c biogenesis protein CcsA [Planctomycetota bacterium]